MLPNRPYRAFRYRVLGARRRCSRVQRIRNIHFESLPARYTHWRTRRPWWTLNIRYNGAKWDGMGTKFFVRNWRLPRAAQF